MHRSLSVILVLGVIGMVLLSVFGSFLVGKVGGAENVTGLRSDLAAIYGSQMADPAALVVKITRDGERFGLRVHFMPRPDLARREGALLAFVRRMGDYVLARREFRSTSSFVVIETESARGEVTPHRFERTDPESGLPAESALRKAAPTVE